MGEWETGRSMYKPRKEWAPKGIKQDFRKKEIDKQIKSPRERKKEIDGRWKKSFFDKFW